MARPTEVTVQIPVEELVTAVIEELVKGGTLVEVVRCRYCQWYSEEHRMCTEHGIEDRDDSGYCSDGIPKQGGVDE